MIVDCPEMCPHLRAVVGSLLLMQIFSMWASLTTVLSAPGLSLGREGLRMAWGFFGSRCTRHTASLTHRQK